MKTPTSVLEGLSIKGMELMVLIDDIIVGMVLIKLGIMEIISIKMVRMKFIVQLGIVGTNVAVGLNTLAIVIRLIRGVS